MASSDGRLFLCVRNSSVAKTEQKGRLVWRKQNTQKASSALQPQGIQPFLGLVGVLFLEKDYEVDDGSKIIKTLRLRSFQSLGATMIFI